MVDQTQLVAAAALNQEYINIAQAMYSLDHGARIDAMIVGRPPTPDVEHPPPDLTRPLSGTLVHTEMIMYPPQMLDGIKQQLSARQNAIREELRKMGVTVGEAGGATQLPHGQRLRR
jgi:hypothetical protein